MKAKSGETQALKKEIDALCKRNMEQLAIRRQKLERIRNKLGNEYPKWAAEHPDLSSTTDLIFSSLLTKAPNGHKKCDAIPLK